MTTTSSIGGVEFIPSGPCGFSFYIPDKPKEKGVAETIHSGTISFFHSAKRLFDTTEGLGHVIKLAKAILLFVQVHFVAIALPRIDALQKHFTAVGGTLMGTVVFKKAEELTKLDKEGRLELYAKSKYKMKFISRLFGLVVSVCDFLHLMRDFGANLASIAAKMGLFSLLKPLVNAGIASIKNSCLVLSCSFAIIHSSLVLGQQKDKDGKMIAGEEGDKVVAALDVLAEIGKICLLSFSAYSFTYVFALGAMVNSVVGIAKTLYKSE